MGNIRGIEVMDNYPDKKLCTRSISPGISTTPTYIR